MMNTWVAPWQLFGGMPFSNFAALVLLILVVWSLVWKALALWNAARDGSKGWFIALLVINSLGILEILYLYVFREKHLARRDRASAAE
jgi:hypothetical protein